MEKANMDIRQYMEDNGVSQRMLAAELGVSQYWVNKHLKNELSQKDKENITAHIDAIIANRNESCDENCVESQESDQPEIPPCAMAFKIGDRVKIPSKALRMGIISDIWNSLKTSIVMYSVDMEDGTRGMYAENQLEAAPLPIEYSFKSVIDGNTAIVTMGR